jgi:hypothetical protein
MQNEKAKPANADTAAFVGFVGFISVSLPMQV